MNLQKIFRRRSFVVVFEMTKIISEFLDVSSRNKILKYNLSQLAYTRCRDTSLLFMSDLLLTLPYSEVLNHPFVPNALG